MLNRLLTAVLAVFLGFSGPAYAVSYALPCGQVQCVGPQISPWRYYLGRGTLGAFPTQESLYQAFESSIYTGYDACSVTITQPDWDDWVYQEGDKQYYKRAEWNGDMNFTLGIPSGYTARNRPYEWIAQANPLFGRPACTTTNNSSIVWIKKRNVKCPSGFVGHRDGSIQGMPWRCAKDLGGRIEITNLGPDPFDGVRLGAQCTGSEELSELVGNPINVTNANKYQVETDYVGSGRFPLTFTRYYNSFPAFSSARYISESEAANLGNGWRHSYARRIVFEQTNNATAYLHRPEGRAYLFAENNNTFTALTASEYRLSRTLDAQGETLSWTVHAASGEVEEYSADGLLIQITDANGEVQALSYLHDLLVSVTDSAGRTLTLAYNSDHKIDSVTDPAGNAYSYNYNTKGVLASVTKPDNTVRTYQYNYTWENLLTAIIDESGNVFAEFVYDYYSLGRGKVLSTQHAGGVNNYQVAYPTPTTTQVVTPSGATRTYTHAAIKGISNVTQVQTDKGARSESFSPEGFLTSRTDESGVTTTFSYDSAGYEISRTEGYGTADAVTTTTAWHPDLRKITQIQRGDRSENYSYDTAGRLASVSVTDGVVTRSTSFSYDAAGRLSSIDGPRTDVSDVTSYSYHPDGSLATVTNPAGHVTTFTLYDLHGNWIEAVTPSGLMVTRGFDTRNRLVWVSRGGEITQYSYTPAGDLAVVTQPDGSFQAFTYDAARRLTQVTGNDGSKLVLTLDNAGNITQRQAYNPDGTQVFGEQQVFDIYDRLTKVVAAGGHETQFSYDAADNLVATTSPLSATSTLTRDALRRITQVVDPDSGITSYVYDELNQIVQVTDPRGVQTDFSRTALGDLLMEASPERGQTVTAVDAAGNVLSQLDANGKQTTYGYDVLNRLVSVGYADGTEATFSYDAGAGIGQMTSMTDPTGTTQWIYDAKGRISGRTQTTGLVTLVESFIYNASGKLASHTLPSGAVVTYSYDSTGRISQMTVNGTHIASNIGYDGQGRVTQWTAGNGETQNRSYDLSGRLVGFTLGTDAQSLAYDAAGRLTQVGSSQILYDSRDQVTGYTGGLGSFLYGYDAAGNRTGLTANGLTDNYALAAASNHLLAVTGSHPRSFSYDAAGNLLSDGAASHVYNAANRRIQTLQGADQVDYRYNGLGQRVQKFGSSLPTRHYLYNSDGSLVGEYTDAGAPVLEMVKLGDLPIAALTPNGTLYAQADHLNTVRALQNAAGVTVWRWNSDPFGAVQPEQDPDGDGVATAFPLRFPGQYYDAETGTHYNYHRDYDPQLGRYAQADPLGVAGGLNVYAYVGNDPVRMVDPLGLEGMTINEALRRIDEGSADAECWNTVFHGKVDVGTCAYWKKPADYCNKFDMFNEHDLWVACSRFKARCDVVDSSAGLQSLCNIGLPPRGTQAVVETIMESVANRKIGYCP